MKAKKIVAYVLSAALAVTALPVIPADTTKAEASETVLGENIALKAVAGADYTNTGTSASNVNNGYLATNSSTTWNTWKKGGTDYPTPVWLEWDEDYVISGMRVVWWADNANITGNEGVTFPSKCEVEYLDEKGEWTPITDMVNEDNQEVESVGVKYNPSDGNGLNGSNQQWNTVTFKTPVKTKKLRLKIERSGSGDNGVGISEWEVFGGKAPQDLGTGENVALNAVVNATFSNQDTSTEKVNDNQLATDESSSTWNSWCKNANLEYPYPVTMEWDKLQELSSMKIMWWADDAKVGDPTDGVLFPESCTAEYYDEELGKWVAISGMVNETGETADTVGVRFGAEELMSEDPAEYTLGKNRYWNGVTFRQTIKTKKLRLYVNRPEGASAQSGIGIGEWQVFGQEVKGEIAEGLNISPKAEVFVEYTNTDTDAKNINDMSLATNSKTSWNTWKKEGDLAYPQPVILSWDEPYDISSMRIMWWADDEQAGTSSGDGVLYPQDCTVQYFDYNTNDWAEITQMENESGEKVSVVGVNGEGVQGANRIWNGILFEQPVKTTKLRLLINRPVASTVNGGIGIGEWEVYGKEISNEFVAAEITGKNQMIASETSTYYGVSVPESFPGPFSYEWSVPEDSAEILQVVAGKNQAEAQVKALKEGKGTLQLKMTYDDHGTPIIRTTSFTVDVEKITSVETYVTSTVLGKAPILPDTVVANGITFDDPTPSLKSATKPDFDFAETFDSALMPVEWEEVDPDDYAQEGEFEVKGKVANSELEAIAKVKVNKPAVVSDANSTVTFENVKLTDQFWSPKQKVNAVNSLNAAIYRIGLSSGGEPNFDNAIKKLNGEPYKEFSGLVFQDTDIYKTLEAISYTLSDLADDDSEEMAKQKKNLEDTLERWIQKIEKVQYADGYINTFFTLRSQKYEGGRAPGTHRWRNFNNHEMYVAGHFLESVVAYTRYREGIGDPDYRLYVAGRRFADHIVERFGPNGTRHEVPGHEEIELALVKFATLVEEYEGKGTGQKYIDTAKLLIDRRGEDYTLRESGYCGYTDGVREYSQDAKPFTEETNAVGHAVRATYLYTGATDVARLLPDDDPDKTAYMNILDTIWDSVANRKTYITGGIGVASHGEDFGADYELPNNDSYNEICASIALTNWNQRMNLVKEDTKYVDVMERALYNGVLVGTNLEGNKFYYANKLEIPKKGGSTDGGMYGGVQRQDWFNCACCPPNLMRTIAKLSEYMYTIHKDNIFVNLYIGSEGTLKVDGTEVVLSQQTAYPWDGAVTISVSPKVSKTFTMNLRIPGWVNEQDNKNVTIKVNGEEVSEKTNKGYVKITREWMEGDKIQIDMPMEIRKTEANPNVTTNAGKIVIERGPIVYAVEKAGNVQLNESISNFDPRNVIIPRDTELVAKYNPDLLNGVVEITGDVTYHTGTEIVPAKLQAVPFYASNNRGDGNGESMSTGMTVWTNASGEQPVQYTVSFDANGGEVSTTSVFVKEGSSIGELPVPERDYHIFKGWYTEAEGGNEITEDTVITDHMTLYAHWEKDSQITIYTIKLDANGGKSPVSSLDIQAGEKIGELPVPVKAGSEFLGWFTQLEGGRKLEPSDVVTQNMTVYAHWNDPEVVFGASGVQTESDGTFLIAMTGDKSPEGSSNAAAYIDNETATGGSALGSTRIGFLAFKLSDEWKSMDPDSIEATLSIHVERVNGNLGTAKTKAGLFAVDQNLADITLENASTYPAKNNDYSKEATVFSKEWICASDLGKKTFDVTEMIREVLQDENATYAMFRLQTVISGFYVSGSGENAPTLTIIEKDDNPQIDQSEVVRKILTILCNAYENIDLSLYSKNSAEEFTKAYDEAKTILETQDASVELVQKSVERLMKAVVSLEIDTSDFEKQLLAAQQKAEAAEMVAQEANQLAQESKAALEDALSKLEENEEILKAAQKAVEESEKLADAANRLAAQAEASAKAAQEALKEEQNKNQAANEELKRLQEKAQEALKQAQEAKAEAEAAVRRAEITEAKASFRQNKVTVKSVKSKKKKQLLLKWSKLAQAEGYQIQYARNAAFNKKGKTKTLTIAGTKTQKVMKKLTRRKKYYVRIRAYKTFDGTRIYTKWSGRKSAKIK